MKKVSLLVGAVFAAIAASACCILPAILGAASAGSVGLSAAFAPYRPYLIGLSVLLLGAGFYFTYRPEKAACGPAGSCATEKTRGHKRLSKGMLWLVTLFTIGSMAYPEIAAYRVCKAAVTAPPLAVVPSSKTAVILVGNMTCAECTLSIVKALKATPDVYDARVDFTAKQAVVRYDRKKVRTANLQDAIRRSGFSATDITE